MILLTVFTFLPLMILKIASRNIRTTPEGAVPIESGTSEEWEEFRREQLECQEQLEKVRFKSLLASSRCCIQSEEEAGVRCSSVGLSSCPYSPKCVEQEFCEVRLTRLESLVCTIQ